MKALILNCTLKASPEKSNTEALAEVVAEALRKEGVEVDSVRAVDHSIPPGIESEMGKGDEWPSIRAQVLESEILILATPTWLGRPSSVAFDLGFVRSHQSQDFRGLSAVPNSCAACRRC
jgi:multimeric flavodoxin WrbA